MYRHLLIMGTASLALCFGAAQAQSQTQTPAEASVQLLDAGAAPREMLRYRFEKGRSGRITLELSTQGSADMGIAQMTMPPLRTRATLAMRIAEVAADGSARIEYELESAEASGDPSKAGLINRDIGKIKGLAGGWYQMDTQGHVTAHGMNTSMRAAGPVQDLINEIEESMHMLAAPMPVEAVGKGARWRVQQKIPENSPFPPSIEFRLRARAGDRVELEPEFDSDKIQDMADAMSPEEMFPGATLKSGKMEAGGKMSFDLGGLVPTGSMKIDITLVLNAPGPGGRNMEVRVNMNRRQSMAPAKD